MPKHIGILTSGGDCPGLNAAIRGVAGVKKLVPAEHDWMRAARLLGISFGD